MAIPAFLQVHTASIERYEGSGPYGDVFAVPVTIPCYFEQVRKVVPRVDGDQLLSGATVYTDLPGTPFTGGTIPDVPANSRITVGGYRSTVITVSVFDDEGVTGLAHQEINLQ